MRHGCRNEVGKHLRVAKFWAIAYAIIVDVGPTLTCRLIGVAVAVSTTDVSEVIANGSYTVTIRVNPNADGPAIFPDSGIDV